MAQRVVSPQSQASYGAALATDDDDDSSESSLPDRLDYQPVFVPLTVLACAVVLVAELYQNGLGSVPGQLTEDCYYQLPLGPYGLLCAAAPAKNPMLGPPMEVLARMGAKENSAILHGEAWRLLTCVYLHAGVLHLLVNMVVLWQLGMRLEKYHGACRVGAVYLIAGSFGATMSAIFAPHSVSVGASGAIFGLLGASIGDVLQNCQLYERPCAALCEFGCAAALQLLLGTMPFVDNFAHFFGFFMGCVVSMGLLLSPGALRSTKRGSASRVAATCTRHLVQALALTAAWLAFAAGLLALYGNWDAHRICSWCSRISCLPFPWGCDVGAADSCWWDCSLCSGGGLSARVFWTGTQQNGSVLLRCPTVSGGSIAAYENVTVGPLDISKMTGSKSLIGLCKGHCPDAYG